MGRGWGRSIEGENVDDDGEGGKMGVWFGGVLELALSKTGMSAVVGDGLVFRPRYPLRWRDE